MGGFNSINYTTYIFTPTTHLCVSLQSLILSETVGDIKSKIAHSYKIRMLPIMSFHLEHAKVLKINKIVITHVCDDDIESVTKSTGDVGLNYSDDKNI